MTSILLQPRTKGADGVGLSTLRNFTKVAAAGYEWVSLYLGGNYGVHDYAIEAAWDAGLPVMLNYERSASDAKNGYPAGKKAAETALVQAKALGFRGEAPLPFSAADEHFADLSGAGLDYHRALVDVLAPEGWIGGAYGFREMLALIAQQSWWPDDWPLWHWGGDGSTIYPWTWVKQGPGGSYFDATIGMQVDRNTLYKPMRFWSGYGPDHLNPDEKIEPAPLEVRDMATFVVSYGAPTVFADGTIHELIAGTKRHVSSDEWFKVLKGAAAGADGKVPVHDSWQPVAYLTDSWYLATLPDYTLGGAGVPGPKGDKGDPGPAPHGTFAISGGSVTL